MSVRAFIVETTRLTETRPVRMPTKKDLGVDDGPISLCRRFHTSEEEIMFVLISDWGTIRKATEHVAKAVKTVVMTFAYDVRGKRFSVYCYDGTGRGSVRIDKGYSTEEIPKEHENVSSYLSVCDFEEKTNASWEMEMMPVFDTIASLEHLMHLADPALTPKQYPGEFARWLADRTSYATRMAALTPVGMEPVVHTVCDGAARLDTDDFADYLVWLDRKQAEVGEHGQNLMGRPMRMRFLLHLEGLDAASAYLPPMGGDVECVEFSTHPDDPSRAEVAGRALWTDLLAFIQAIGDAGFTASGSACPDHDGCEPEDATPVGVTPGGRVSLARLNEEYEDATRSIIGEDWLALAKDRNARSLRERTDWILAMLQVCHSLYEDKQAGDEAFRTIILTRKPPKTDDARTRNVLSVLCSNLSWMQLDDLRHMAG